MQAPGSSSDSETTVRGAGKGELSGSLLEAVRKAIILNTVSLEAARHANRYQTVAFEFTRYLKGHQLVAGLSAKEAAELVEAELVEIKGEEFPWVAALGDQNLDGKSADPYLDFLNCWEKIKNAGMNTLQEAIARTRTPDEPSEFGDRLSRDGRKAFRHFLRVCRYLQDRAGEDPFFVPVKVAGPAFGVDPKQVSRWRRAAVELGFLKVVQKWDSKRATRFRFLASEHG